MPLSLGSLHHESKQRRQEEASTFYDPSSEVKLHHFCFILVVSEKVTRPKPFYRRKKAHKHKKEPTIAKDQFRSYLPPQSHCHCSGDCTLEVTEGRQCSKMAESHQISRKLGSGRDLTKEGRQAHPLPEAWRTQFLLIFANHVSFKNVQNPVSVLNQQMSCSDTSCPSKTCLKVKRPCPHTPSFISRLL